METNPPMPLPLHAFLSSRRIAQGLAALVITAMTATVFSPVAASAASAAPNDKPGSAYSWGQNYFRQLGDGQSFGTDVSTPSTPPGLGTGLSQIVSYGGGSYALGEFNGA